MTSGTAPTGDVVAPSSGILIASFQAGGVVYDLDQEVAHVLGPLGLWLASLDVPTSIDDLVREANQLAGVPRATVEEAIAAMRDLELLDRRTPSIAAAAQTWIGSQADGRG